MKALPLWQPWAQLVVIGAKCVETRSWRCPPTVVDQRIAIHATKTTKHLGIRRFEPFYQHLRGDRLPLGAIIGTVVVARCDPITAATARGMELSAPDEFAFGDYRPGRWGWTLIEPRVLDRPVPYKGRQGMFEIPDNLVPAAWK